MISRFLKSSVRGFAKNKTVTTINIIGLSIGITVCLIIYQYISYELSYDKHSEHSDLIYRIERDPFCTIAPSFVPLLKNDFPEIEEIARMLSPSNAYVKCNENTFLEHYVSAAEPDILNILPLKLINGDAENALLKGNVIISESTAKKFLGNEDPLGNELTLHGTSTFTISGVFKDYPHNSHIKCNIICPYLSLRDYDVDIENDYFLGNNNFSDNVTLAYVKFAQNTNVDEFKSKLPAFVDRYLPARRNANNIDVPASNGTKFTVRKLTDIHLHSKKMNELETNSDISYIYLFLVLAILILAIACINFFNLSTATIDEKFKEFGVKKVLGVKKRIIYSQLFFDSVFLVFIASVLALGLNQLVLPYLKIFLEVDKNITLVSSERILFASIFILVVLALTTCIVPGSILSRKGVIEILNKNILKSQGKANYRNVLVVFQFIVSISLFVCIGTIYSQMNYLNEKDLGFKKDNIILIPASNEIIDNWKSIHQDFVVNSNIKNATLSNRTIGGRLLDAPGLLINLDGEFISWPGRIPHVRVEHNFFKTYEVNLLAGSDFNPNKANDNSKEYILNETAVKHLGIENYQDIIGKRIRANGEEGKVTGVVKDFHYESLHSEILPMVTYVSIPSTNILSVKVNQYNLEESLAYIKDVLGSYISNYDFTYSFFNERLAMQYKNENKMKLLIACACAVSILIAGLGLLGLVIFTSQKRIKEIGIRKVNGAKVFEILAMLNKDFLKWIVISFLIACPIAYYSMTKWLENFAYKTELSWWVFILAGILALGIALLTVSWQSWRAATKNPVEALRYE